MASDDWSYEWRLGATNFQTVVNIWMSAVRDLTLREDDPEWSTKSSSALAITAGVLAACTNIERYYRVAINQQSRIAETDSIISAISDQLSELSPPENPADHLKYNEFATRRNALEAERRRRGELQLADVHFYLNAWKIVSLNIGGLAFVTGDDGLRELCAQQGIKLNNSDRKVQFERNPGEQQHAASYAKARDHFEHLDERMMGRTNLKTIHAGPDFDLNALFASGHAGFNHGNDIYVLPSTNGNTLRVGSQEWDVGPDSLSLLTSILDDVKRIGNDRINAAFDHPNGK